MRGSRSGDLGGSSLMRSLARRYRAYGERECDDRRDHGEAEPSDAYRVQPAKGHAPRIVSGKGIEWNADGRAESIDPRADDKLRESTGQGGDGARGAASPRSRAADDVEHHNERTGNHPGVEDHWQHASDERARE